MNRGPAGPIGPIGPKGDTGNTGLHGAKGDTGATGATGETGETGLQGLKGDTGLQGVKGDTGLTGLQGQQGERGPVGFNASNSLIERIAVLEQPAVFYGNVIVTDVTVDVLTLLLKNVEQLVGTVTIYNSGITSAQLQAIFGNLHVIYGSLRLDGNTNLVNLEGMRNLTDIGGDLYIGGNTKLADLQGVRSLKSVHGLAYPLTTCNTGVINCVSTPACSAFTSVSACLTTYVGDVTLTEENVAVVAASLNGF